MSNVRCALVSALRHRLKYIELVVGVTRFEACISAKAFWESSSGNLDTLIGFNAHSGHSCFRTCPSYAMCGGSSSWPFSSAKPSILRFIIMAVSATGTLAYPSLSSLTSLIDTYTKFLLVAGLRDVDLMVCFLRRWASKSDVAVPTSRSSLL